MLHLLVPRWLSPGGPVFDLEKLRWLNGQHIRRHTVAEFMALLERWGYRWPDAIPQGARERIAEIAQARIETLADFAPLVAFFAERPELAKSDLEVPKLDESQAKLALTSAQEELAGLEDPRWNQAEIGEQLPSDFDHEPVDRSVVSFLPCAILPLRRCESEIEFDLALAVPVTSVKCVPRPRCTDSFKTRAAMSASTLALRVRRGRSGSQGSSRGIPAGAGKAWMVGSFQIE